MAGIQGNIIVSVTDNNVSVQEGNVSNISVTSTTSNIELVAGSTFFPYDQILRDMIPGSNGVLTLGNATNYWDSLYVENIFTANDQIIYNGNLDVQNGSLTVNGSNNTLTGELQINGNVDLNGNLFIDRSVGGTLTGQSNKIFSESLFPHITSTFSLGDSGNVWTALHVEDVNADLYQGQDTGANANVNPLAANALVFNTTSILSRGNALIFDSAHGTGTSDERIIITSGGTEGGSITGKQLGIIIDESANLIFMGDGCDIQNPANSITTGTTGLEINTATGNATLRGQNVFSIQSGTYEGNGRSLVGLTGSQLAGNIDTDDVSEGTTNLYLNGAGTTDDLAEGGSNQYFTTARANSAIGAYTGSFTNVGDISGSGNVTAFNSLNATNGGVFAESGLSKFQDANVSGRFNVGGNINIQNGQIDATTVNATGNIEGAVLKGTSIAITGDSSITGNLNVTGNINSETVVDLLVEDRNITLQYGQAGTPSANSQIFVDRGSEANSYILWDENGDAWKFSNDGNVEYLIPTSTTDLAEGTNLYYTQSRFDTAFGSKTTSDLSEGTNLYFTTDRANLNSDAWIATKSTSDLAEGTNLYYTNARANAAFTDSLDNIATEISSTANITTTTNVSGSYFVGNVDATTVTATGNVDAGNVLTDVVESDSSASLKLKGQANGLQIDKTIASTETDIIDIDTDGYTFTSGDLGTANVTSANVPAIMLNLLSTGNGIVAGSNTFVVQSMYYNSFQMCGVQSGLGVFSVRGYTDGAAEFFQQPSSLEASLNDGDMYFYNPGIPGFQKVGTNQPKLEGWKITSISDTSVNSIFPAEAYVTGISGNTVTMSHNATSNVAANSLILGFPYALSSTQPGVQYRMNGDTSQFNIPYTSATPTEQFYQNPETLSNATLDIVSYVDDSVTLANTVSRHIADLDVGDSSAVRINQALLIGANATPDVFSGGKTTTSEASILGLTLENDGLTTYASGNTTPQTKFLINQYTQNSPAELSSVPSYASGFATGYDTEDLLNLGAPAFNFKMLNGNKDDRGNLKVSANAVVGKVQWNAISADTTGSDILYPPSAITVKVNEDHTTSSNIMALDMYLQTTNDESYRNGTTNANGGIPQTFLANKKGNTVVAAKATGTIELRPFLDYGDANGNINVNRFPERLHEYHSFLSAGYDNTSAKSGTVVTIQPKSGETNGNASLTNGYDSKGNATLRLQVHEANSAVKKTWDILAEQSTGNLDIVDNTTGTPDVFMHLNGGRVFVDKSFRLQNLTTTEINAIASPEAGDMVFNTTLNQVCFYNGTAWQKITSATM